MESNTTTPKIIISNLVIGEKCLNNRGIGAIYFKLIFCL